VINADGGWRRGNEVKLKEAADEALHECPSVLETIVYRRTGSAVAMRPGRDFWRHDLE
jgi:acetyl-CoA synthetase